MNPYEFAGKHLQPYKISGNEIIPAYCPMCHGGQNKDKDTFAMNTDTGIYNCKRGSCGSAGTFNQLLREFGEMKNYEFQRPKKTFKAPATKPETASDKAAAYLKQRGFSTETWQRRGVGCDGDGNIVMPYYENGKPVLMKFRPAHKVKKGEKKGWREEGGKPVFWGMDDCAPDKPLLICEGEMDALALDEAGLTNVVSVPSGVNDLDCIDLCWDWISQFKRVVLWADNDEPGQGLQRNLVQRLGAWRCSVVQNERKDANEVLLFDGKQAVLDAVKNAVEVPINGLVRLDDVKPFDYSKATRINSGIRGLDNAIGGFITTQVTLWTGDNSAGKSTLLGQVMLEAVEQRFPLCCYSGELAASIFKYWIELQAAGPNWLEGKHDTVKNGPIYNVKHEAVKEIRAWYRDYFFLCDSFGGIKEDNLFELFEYAAMRYGCRVFVIDNLMTVDANSKDNDYYRNQAQFLNNVMNFAHTHDCHIHIVAHPRKAQGKIAKDDVKGAKDLTNRVDNVIAVHRLNEKERQEYGCVSTAEILKNRLDGQQDIEIQLSFDERCKRFGMATDRVPKRYGWELTKVSLKEVEGLFNGKANGKGETGTPNA